MFIAILMTGIFPEARAEPVVLRPSPDEGIEIAQAGSGEPTGNTVGRRDRPGVITIPMASAQLLRLEKRPKTVIVGDHSLIDVVIENDQLAVLTAKDNPGRTNIIVLNEDGSNFERVIDVRPRPEGPDDSVRIHNQKSLADFTPYQCGAGGRPRCTRIPDEKAYIDRVLSQSRWDNQNLNYSGNLGGGGTPPASPP
jgi:hypothetical protein